MRICRLLAHGLVGQQVLADLVETVKEVFARPLVPFAEFLHHLVQLPFHLGLGLRWRCGP